MPTEKPLNTFEHFKEALRQHGYIIEVAQPYTPLQVADVNFNNIQNGEVEITNEGIFYVNPHNGSRHQIFLYKRNYDIQQYGKPRFHIRNCMTIQQIGKDQYRRANTGTVVVYDRNKGADVAVKGLPLCKNCLSIVLNEGLLNYGRDMTSTEFEEILRTANEDATEEQNADLEGYVWKWQKISEAYRTKKEFTCERCGYKPNTKISRQYIHVHHKDGNKTNNRESNLECLCIACHSNVDLRHRSNFSKGANKVMLDNFTKQHPKAGH